MNNSDLVRLNEQQKAEGQPPYANTRNVAAGSIRLLDPRMCRERKLRFFCHAVGDGEGLDAQSHMEFLEEMAGYGIPATPEVECFPTFDAAVEHCEELIERLHELDFEVDGLVLKVNRFDQRERLGTTSKSPALDHRLQVREIRSHDPRRTPSACRSARPARSRPWPIWSRSNWPARSSAAPACTMPTKSSARTSASATWWWWKRRAR